MSERIVIASKNQILYYNDSKLSYLNSQYLKNYKKILMKLAKNTNGKPRELMQCF